MLLLVASFSTSLAITSTANAISDYDSVIQSTNQLKVYYKGAGCSNIFDVADTKNFWAEVFTKPTNINQNTTQYLGNEQTGIPFSWNGGTVNGGGVARKQWDDKKFWSVSTTTDWQNDYSSVQITYTNDPNAKIKFRTNNGVKQLYYEVGSTYVVRTVRLEAQNWAGNPAWNATGTNGCGISAQDIPDNPVITDESPNSYVYFAYGNFEKPDGYQGVTPPQVAPNQAQNKIRPNVVLDVMNKQISINSKVNDTIKAQVPDYKVYWFITNATFDGSGVPPNCGETSFSTSGYSLPNEPLTFEVPCYAKYSVNAYFAYNNGEYPIANFDDYTIVETTINVDVNGGFFSLDTDNNFVCDENNYCYDESTAWVDEQCDLTHLGGCVNNILHQLKVVLGIEKTATNPTGSPFVSFRTETYGLMSIVSAPITAINALTMTRCVPITLTIPYVNKNITLPCYYSIYQSKLGDLFILYQTIATGVIAYYVLVGILRQVKEIKDPKKDQIEVVEL